MANPKKKKPATCRVCSVDFEYSPSQSLGFYCSNQCVGKARLAETAQRFLRGEITERATLKRFVTERDSYRCKPCNLTEWQGKPLSLQLDHTDGNPSNNNPENLRLICPNCHSQTPHFGARNKGKGRKALGLPTR